MATGIRINHDSGATIIDENYANLALRAKGSLVIGSTQLESFTVPYAITNLRKPVIALRVTGGYAGLRNARRNDVSMTTTVGVVGDVGANVEWFCFDMPIVISTAGIKIFDATGKVVFDAGNKYARVVDYWEPATVSAWNGITRNYPDGRKLAVAFLTQWYRRNATSSTSGCGGSQRKYRMFYEAQMCQVTSGQNNTTFSRRTWRQDDTFGECTSNDPRDGRTKSVIAMLDVTGY